MVRLLAAPEDPPVEDLPVIDLTAERPPLRTWADRPAFEAQYAQLGFGLGVVPRRPPTDPAARRRRTRRRLLAAGALLVAVIASTLTTGPRAGPLPARREPTRTTLLVWSDGAVRAFDIDSGNVAALPPSGAVRPRASVRSLDGRLRFEVRHGQIEAVDADGTRTRVATPLGTVDAIALAPQAGMQVPPSTQST